ncbi:MAG: anti-sigma factor [Bauldia sp.]
MSPLRIPSEDELVAFADGRLAAEREAEVAAWLQLPENAAAQTRVEDWRAQGPLLRAALDPVLSEPVPASFPGLTERQPKRARWFIPAAAAAAIGIIAGIGGGWAIWGPEPAIAREIADIGLSAHGVFIREVRHPVEVTVDEETHLVNWLSSRLDMPVTPPDLTAEGLTLLGGRLVPDNGKPAAQLMYEDGNGQRYTLLIARTEAPETTALIYAWEPDICAYYWMDGTVGYVFAGPEDRDLVYRLTRAVYDQLS